MKKKKQVFGMVHVQALPGTPSHQLSVSQIIEKALVEATTLLTAGFDGLIIENMHDAPYLNRNVGPEIVAVMSIISKEIRQLTENPIGIQVLAGANREALAIAHAADLDFIRAEGFVYGHVADEGYMDAQAGELLRYRRFIGAEDVKIYTDIKKKHSSHAITADVSLKDSIEAAELFLSDGIIITGTATGKAVDLDDLIKISHTTHKPLLLGSGLSAENISKYWNYADVFIIGSYLKEEQLWSNALDIVNIQTLFKVIKKLKQADGE